MTSPYAETAPIVCPACGTHYPATTRYCEMDGTVLSASMAISMPAQNPANMSLPGTPVMNNALPKQCPSCRNVYPNYAQFCPSDATRLVLLAPAVDHRINTPVDSVYGQPNPAGQQHFSGVAQPQPSVHGAPAGRDAYSQEYRAAQADPRESRNANAWQDKAPAAQSDSGEFQVDPLQSLESQLIGRTVAGKYRVDSLLGEGGMAQVFKSTHLGLDRPVVIKIMHSGLPSMDTAMKRFEQECKVTAKIDHPNVVSVFDVGALDRRPYLVMEFIQGESLRDYLDREVSMEIREAATVMMQVCSGLYEAHQQGIIHRDLKPENIMLRERSDRPDWVKIVDFGIAHLKQGGQRLTRTGIAIGTVDYMSPEYLSDKPIDHRADIYALGVILYELIAGRCPFVAETAEAIMAKHLWGTPNPLSHYRPDLPAGCMFDKIAEKSLHKEPAERYQSVMEMKNDLVAAMREFESVAAS